MGWIHDVPEDDLYEHEGYVVAVLADGSEPEPLQFPVPGPDMEGVTTGNSGWWLYTGEDGRPLATAVRAACECGWRSTDTFPVDFDDEESTEGYEFNEGPFAAWSYGHIASLLGTAMPRELTEALDTVGRLVRQLADERPIVALTAIGRLEKVIAEYAPTAGATARTKGEAWSSIGRALGTTRQAAYQRFARHLPAELSSNPQD